MKQITINGTAIDIRPLRVKHLTEAARIAEPIMRAVAEAGSFDPMKLLRHADDIIALVALATGTEEAWVGDLDATDLMELAAAVIEVNADFFTRSLVPRFEALTQNLSTTSLHAQLTPSSAPATG